jgi:hypothetical protein
VHARQVPYDRDPYLRRAVTHCKQGVGVEPLFMLRCDRSQVMLTWLRQLPPACSASESFPLRGSLERAIYGGKFIRRTRA